MESWARRGPTKKVLLRTSLVIFTPFSHPLTPNCHPLVVTHHRKIVVYVLLLADALFAGRLDLKVKRNLLELTTDLHQTLKYTTLAMMEETEVEHIQDEATRAENAAHNQQVKAARTAYQSRVDQVYATKDSHRGAYFVQAATQEQSKADNAWSNAHADERIHITLLANMSMDLADEREALEQLQALKRGKICSHPVVQPICAVLGHAAELQQQVDQEALQIHQEWLEAQLLRHEEYMEELVAGILQGKATQFNRTAVALLQAADVWNQQAEYDINRAASFNATAIQLEAVANRLQQRAHEEANWQSKNRSTAQQYQEDMKAAHHCVTRDAALAVLTSLPAIFFFTVRVLMGLSDCFSVWEMQWRQKQNHNQGRSSSSNVSDKDSYRGWFSWLQHALIFLFCVGITGKDFGNIALYETWQCGAVVIRFVVLASFLQGVLLHALPHAVSEWPLDRSDVKQIAKNFGRRLVTLAALFAVEVLLAWLVVEKWLFSAGTVSFCGSALFRLLALTFMVMDVVCFGPHVAQDVSDGQSTVLTDADDASVIRSETSWLIVADESIKTSESPTEALVSIDLSSRGRHSYDAVETESTYTSSSTSPYSVSIQEELCRLALPFDALVLCCMLVVFRNAMSVASVDSAYLVRCLAVVSLVLVTVAGWMIHRMKAPRPTIVQIPDMVKESSYFEPA